MELRNPFPISVRNLFLYSQYCFQCKSNGNGRGGLELHHILGRVSGCALNACVLCHYCHEKVGHTRAEHSRMFRYTMTELYKIGYTLNEEDLLFLKENYEELGGNEITTWVKQL